MRNSIAAGLSLGGGLNLGGGLTGGTSGLANTNKGLLGGLNLAGTQKSMFLYEMHVEFANVLTIYQPPPPSTHTHSFAL